MLPTILDLDHEDVAIAHTILTLRLFGMTFEQMANAWGESPERVARRLDLVATAIKNELKHCGPTAKPASEG